MHLRIKESQSVKKRLKDKKQFAAQVSREDIRCLVERAGIQLEELIKFVIIIKLMSWSYS